MKTRHEWLDAWEILAVLESVRAMKLEARSKEALLKKLERATHVRIAYQEKGEGNA